jgi:hypothetical protein
VTDGLLVGVAALVAVCVGAGVGCCEAVGRGVLVRVAEAVRVWVREAGGSSVWVALINGTSVGGMNLVAVALGVGGSAVGLPGDCQRQMRIAAPKQYNNREVSSATARIKASNFWLGVRRAYCSVALRNSVSPEWRLLALAVTDQESHRMLSAEMMASREARR